MAIVLLSWVAQLSASGLVSKMKRKVLFGTRNRNDLGSLSGSGSGVDSGNGDDAGKTHDVANENILSICSASFSLIRFDDDGLANNTRSLNRYKWYLLFLLLEMNEKDEKMKKMRRR